MALNYSKIINFYKLYVSVGIFLAILVGIFSPVPNIGDSNYPNLIQGDILFGDTTYKLLNKTVKRGQLVSVRPPEGGNIRIKRIIGLPLERILIENGYIWINGNKLLEQYLLSQTKTYELGKFLREGQEVQIPPRMYFVLGDNRNTSRDSRDYGFVPEENIQETIWGYYRFPFTFKAL